MDESVTTVGARVRRVVIDSWWVMSRSLRNRNLRNYLTGHGISSAGVWIQQTAELWLLLQLTGSGAAVGLHSVLRFGPLLVFGVYGGVIADRLDRRILLVVSQGILFMSAVVIAVVTWIGEPAVPLVYGVVATQGLVFAVDNPLRRSFLRDLANDDEVTNAVSMHASVGTLARTLAPAIGGVLIATSGVAICFTINAVSFLFFLAALARLDRSTMRRQVLVRRAPRQLRDGVVYAWRQPPIRWTLALCAVISVFAWNWNVLVPFYATDEFGGGASLFGTLLSVLGIGAAIGTLAMTRANRIPLGGLLLQASVVAVALFVLSWAPTVAVGGIGLMILGAAGGSFTVAAQARLQLDVADHLSGRVLALFSVLFLGMKPIGSMLAGWLVDLVDARFAFGVGGVVVLCVVIAMIAWRAVTSAKRGG